jgi:hypothetical protein
MDELVAECEKRPAMKQLLTLIIFAAFFDGMITTMASLINTRIDERTEGVLSPIIR